MRPKQKWNVTSVFAQIIEIKKSVREQQASAGDFDEINEGTLVYLINVKYIFNIPGKFNIYYL